MLGSAWQQPQPCKHEPAAGVAVAGSGSGSLKESSDASEQLAMEVTTNEEPKAEAGANNNAQPTQAAPASGKPAAHFPAPAQNRAMFQATHAWSGVSQSSGAAGGVSSWMARYRDPGWENDDDDEDDTPQLGGHNSAAPNSRAWTPGLSGLTPVHGGVGTGPGINAHVAGRGRSPSVTNTASSDPLLALADVAGMHIRAEQEDENSAAAVSRQRQQHPPATQATATGEQQRSPKHGKQQEAVLQQGPKQQVQAAPSAVGVGGTTVPAMQPPPVLQPPVLPQQQGVIKLEGSQPVVVAMPATASPQLVMSAPIPTLAQPQPLVQAGLSISALSKDTAGLRANMSSVQLVNAGSGSQTMQDVTDPGIAPVPLLSKASSASQTQMLLTSQQPASSSGPLPDARQLTSIGAAPPLSLAGVSTAAEAAAAIAATAAESAVHVTPEEAKLVVVVKALTRSDATTRRIILPRISIEANLPEAAGLGSLRIQAWDPLGNPWEFSLRAWSNGHNPKPVYVLEHIADFMREFAVKEGDVLGICRTPDRQRFLIEINTHRVRAALVQPGFQAVTLQRAQHAARMRHQQNRELRERQMATAAAQHQQVLRQRQHKAHAAHDDNSQEDLTTGVTPCTRKANCTKPAGHSGWCGGSRQAPGNSSASAKGSNKRSAPEASTPLHGSSVMDGSLSTGGLTIDIADVSMSNKRTATPSQVLPAGAVLQQQNVLPNVLPGGTNFLDQGMAMSGPQLPQQLPQQQQQHPQFALVQLGPGQQQLLQQQPGVYLLQSNMAASGQLPVQGLNNPVAQPTGAGPRLTSGVLAGVPSSPAEPPSWMSLPTGATSHAGSNSLPQLSGMASAGLLSQQPHHQQVLAPNQHLAQFAAAQHSQTLVLGPDGMLVPVGPASFLLPPPGGPGNSVPAMTVVNPQQQVASGSLPGGLPLADAGQASQHLSSSSLQRFLLH